MQQLSHFRFESRMRVERILERIVAVLCNVIRPLRGGRTEKKALHVKKGQAASHDGSF